MMTMTTPRLGDPRQYDCCAHVTKGGNRCGALRWYHDDPGRARHKFVEPQRTETEAERLRDVLTRVQTWLVAPALDVDTIAEMRTMVNDALGYAVRTEKGTRA